MDTLLQILLIAVGTWLGVMLLSTITKYFHERAQQPVPTLPQPDPTPTLASSDAAIRPFPYTVETPEQEHTAEYWWKRLLSGSAVLGAVFVPLQLLALYFNSWVLALRMELMLGQAGSSLFVLNVFGWERDITTFDILGCLISLTQVVAAAAYANRGKVSGPKIMAAATWILMVLVEVLLSVMGAANDGGGVPLMIMNGAMALGLAFADSLFGLYMLELFLVPLVMALAWTIALPFRIGVKGLRVKGDSITFGPKPSAMPQTPQPKKRRIASFIGSFDALFVPLRKMDAIISQVLQQLFYKIRDLRFKSKGESQMSKTHLAKSLALLLGITLTLLGSGCGNSTATTSATAKSFAITPVGAPLHCFLGKDVTPTVDPSEFAVYPNIAAHSVLPCLHAGDRVYQLVVNSNAEGQVKTFNIATGKMGLNEEVRKIYESLAAIPQDRSRGITTNLGSFLSHVKKTVNAARAERAQLQKQGKTAAREVRYVVVLLTDGLPDGVQTIDDDVWPQDVEVFAYGVKRDYEAKFRQLCVEKMKIPAESLHIKLFSGWSAAAEDFGPAINRRPDPKLLEYLLTNTESKAGI